MQRNAHGVALVLLVALVPFALDGCVSMRVSALAERSQRSHLEVAVYENASSRDAGRPVEHPVLTHLYRVDGKRAQSVARSLSARWRADDLPAGRYRLEATKEIDLHGDIRELPSGGTSKTFAVSEGGSVRVDVLRRKVPVALIVVSALTLVAIVALAVVLVHEGDLPDPPVPPPLPLLPGEAFVAFDWSLASHAARGEAPGAADVFPARGSVVAARRVAVTFLLVTGLGEDPDPSAVTALGSASGEISGTVSWLPAEQLLRFAPSRDFIPGEIVTVTLDLGKLRSESGTRGEGLFSTSFTVPE